MKARNIIITFILLGVLLITVAHVQRGEFGAGGEWFLMLGLVPMVYFVPMKERKTNGRAQRK